MVNSHVIDQAAILGRTAAQPVGLGSYKMDSHSVQYHVDERGYIAAEGDVQMPVKGPYQIDYRALLPERAECENLLVPVCLAATHLADGSIRMESVFMVLAQSAGLAAVLACEGGGAVQDIDYVKLQALLEESGQVLALPTN